MKEILKKNLFFLIPYGVFLFFGIIVLTIYSKPQIHIFMNSHYSLFFDKLFYYLTYLGDGIFAVTVIFFTLFWRFRNFLFMASSILVSFGVITFLKQIAFHEVVRPYAYFNWVYHYQIRLIEGVDYHGFNSFPSGHTMSAFCIFFGLALIVKKKWLKFFFFIIALLTGYSRVYLSQHFFVDIVAGSLIAVVITLFFYYIFSKIENKWIDRSFNDIS